LVKKLAIITTHPIQYYAPVFSLLSRRQQIHIRVFYTWSQAAISKHDPGFNKNIAWDIPLLDGYEYEWVNNTSPDPGSHHFNGIINPGLTDRVNAYRPDAVLVIGWAYKSHLKAMRYFKNKVPVLFRGDSTLLAEKGNLASLFKAIFLRWVYRHADYAFYNGINNRAYFIKYGLETRQLIFAPHAVDNTRFAASRKEEALAFRESLNAASDMIILFTGKLEEQKDPFLLLDAFIALNKPNTHLLFAGTGVLENDLKAKAEPNKNIHFAGFQNQAALPVIYQACDLFCLPSKGETWGLVVNEAMAAGKAVLISDQCGCAADLVHEGNGAIFKSGSHEQLLSCLEKLTSDKEQLTMRGANASRDIEPWNFLNIAKAVEGAVFNLKS
jgi:glycosyltransferase involved in cell wall biosynthesis